MDTGSGTGESLIQAFGRWIGRTSRRAANRTDDRVRVTRSATTYVAGWWELAPELPALVNRWTQERVTLCVDANAVDVGMPGTWLRFDYEHPELRFPVVAEVRPRVVNIDLEWGKAALIAVRKEQRMSIEQFVRRNPPPLLRDLELRIDYGRSAQVWRAETGATAAHPPYGAWRRVDDCITDALCCWPVSGTTSEPLAPLFHVHGGWVNGSWDEALERVMWPLPEQGRTRMQEESEITAEPWLMPLDAPAPSPFQFHDVDVEAGDGPVDVADSLLPDGLEVRSEPPPTRLRLPRSRELSGFEGRVAFMRSRDGRRVLYPHRAVPRVPGYVYDKPEVRFLYADDDIVCDVLGKPGMGATAGAGASWWFSTETDGFGRRDDAVDPALAMVTSGGPSPSPAPSRAAWLRVFWAVVDAWSQWPGPRAPGPRRWLQNLWLVGPSSLEIGCGYRGGGWFSRTASCRLKPPDRA